VFVAVGDVFDANFVVRGEGDVERTVASGRIATDLGGGEAVFGGPLVDELVADIQRNLDSPLF
jgi:hypothetical protein